MQILVNALPGFRDLRAPLVTGYFWLVFAWLVVQPDFAQPPTQPFERALFDLAGDVGHVWLGVGIGIVAYLVGSLSLAGSDVLRVFAFELRGDWSASAAAHEERLIPLIAYGQNLLKAADRLTGSQVQQLKDLLLRRASVAREEAARELDLPAILLIGDQPELFAEVDRLRSEGELRMAIFLPLVAISLLASVEVSWWCSLMIPGAAILFRQGMERDLAARTSIANAIRLGKAPSAASSRFSDWLERTFVGQIKENEDSNASAAGGIDPLPTASSALQGDAAAS
jgi:hypothetical protein